MSKEEFYNLKHEIKQYLPGADFVYDSKTKTAMVQSGNVKHTNIQIPVALLFEIFEDFQNKIDNSTTENSCSCDGFSLM